MGIKNAITRVGAKAGDSVAKLAVLSPEQLQEVEDSRDFYLSQKPDPTDTAAEELTKRLLAASSVEIYNAYLPQLRELYIPLAKDSEYAKPFCPEYNIRYFNITKWVTDKKENNLEKLVNVYDVLSNEECNIALIFHRTCDNTEVYMAVVNTQNADSNTDINNYKNRITEALKGNFPGCEIENSGAGIIPYLNDRASYSVASASNVPTEKSEKFISQTIEKLLDGCVPDSLEKEYTLILLATPILDSEERKLRLSEIYSGLAPYASWTTDYHYTESNSVGSSATVGVNVGASAGIQNGQNQSTGTSAGETDSTSDTQTTSNSSTDTDTEGGSVTDTEGTSTTESSTHTEGSNRSTAEAEGVSNTVGGAASVGVGHAAETETCNAIIYQKTKSITDGKALPKKIVDKLNPFSKDQKAPIVDSLVKALNLSANVSLNGSHGTSQTTTETVGSSLSDALTKGTGTNASKSIASSASHSIANTVGNSISSTLGKAFAKTVSKTVGTFKSTNLGMNFGVNFARASNVTATIGKNEGITQSYTNYTVKHALELLEEQMKRYEQSTALGMWDFAAYVLSEDLNMANNVAHSYIALTQGEKSYTSRSAINLWRGDMGEESREAKEICGYLKELRHPVFGLNPSVLNEIPQYLVYPSAVTATTSLSGKELAYSLNFPRKSVSGLPVIECAEFGRNIVTYDGNMEKKSNSIHLGQIYHMHHKENNLVELQKQSMASHTFITGSTGSGKSNTVYQILQETREIGVKFLVVEPAKGEYKSVFGMDEDVSVYGTNPDLTPILKIDPFSFPKGIHILEHLDRLIEIFNVCWPMYAAMPAVLKKAVELAYVDCGWNLMTSKNDCNQNFYPTFNDVAENVKKIIDSSEYDTDNKGAYKGSLLTRLESLTTGLNRMIFVQDELAPEELFDKNVIVDLSRVGSSETKSLIMGMLILKLQEHRMAENDGMNQELKHLTVLEEAHNILKRTSTEQSSESSNLLGKSVEMLANAIAEMRTYGEGFIIADQAPGLLDMSVIRNTNTKIIMRLPDKSDRELVGRAANLNDDQIVELAKLPCGVAAVYQNEWIQPVLCKVQKYNGKPENYKYESTNKDAEKEEIDLGKFIDYLTEHWEEEVGINEIEKGFLTKVILNTRIRASEKYKLLEKIKEGATQKEIKVRFLYDYVNADVALQMAGENEDIIGWIHTLLNNLNSETRRCSAKQLDNLIAILLMQKIELDESYNDVFCDFTERYMKNEKRFW